MNKIPPISFSFIVSLVISFTFLFITFFIFYKFSWDVNAAKDALSTTGSYFGAVATLGAAIVAAYLFNDWRIVQRAQSKSDISKQIITSLIKLKSDADKYHANAQHYVNAYEQRNDQDISQERKNKIIEFIQNSPSEKDLYDTNLEVNLINFFELLDLYEAIFNENLLNENDREFNFKVYFFTINGLFSLILSGDEEKIKLCSNTCNLSKSDFEHKFYRPIINSLKTNITLQNDLNS